MNDARGAFEVHGAVIPMIRKISGKVPSASRNVVLKSPYEKRARALMRLCARQNHQVLEISSYRVNFGASGPLPGSAQICALFWGITKKKSLFGSPQSLRCLNLEVPNGMCRSSMGFSLCSKKVHRSMHFHVSVPVMCLFWVGFDPSKS